MAAEAELRIYVVEDDPGMRSLYQELLESIALATRFFANGEDFLEHWSPDWLGGLILDMRMPGIGGIEVLRRLRERGSTLPAVVVTGFGEVRSSVEAMKLGAMDFLEKPFANAELLAVVNTMLAQTRQQLAQTAVQQDIETALATLSAREREVGQLIARGLTSREIGALLEISPRTVDVHRAHLIEKLGCASSVELAALLSRLGVG